MPVPPARPPDDLPVRTRRVIRRLARLAGGACAVAGLLLFALHSGPARRFALNRATAFLASRHIELGTSELRYNLFRLSVDLRDLQLRSAGSAETPVFARIGRARVDLSLAAFLRGRVVVQSALAEDVNVDYIVAADGRDNLPRLPRSSDQVRKPPDDLIANLAVSRMRVRYANAAQRVDAVISLPSASLTGNPLTRRHQIEFASADGRMQVRNHAAAVDRIAGVLDLGQDDVRLGRLQIETPGSRVEVTGRVHEFDAPKLELTLHAGIDAAQAAGFLDVRDPVSGTVAVDATVRGLLAAPAIDARASGSGLRFRSLGAAQLDVRAAYDARARRAELASARVHAPWGRIAATGQLALDRDHTSRVRVQIDDITVAAVMHGLNLPYAAETQADGKLDAEWPGLDYLDASGQGSATLTTATESPTGRAMPVAGSFSASRSQGTTILDLSQLTAAGVELTGQVRIGNGRRLDGELSANVPDIARTVGAAERFLARRSLLPARVNGTARVDARLGGTVETPAADVSVSSPSVSIGAATGAAIVGSSRVDLQACKLEYSIVSPK